MAKQSNKLTAKTVKNLAYDPASNNKHADGGGLYLFIHENGSKYWRLDYRRPISQKRNTLALGVYDEVTLEKARLKRDEVKRMLADGIDPAEERNQHRDELKAKLENTFEKFATEWLKIRELEGKVDRETIRKLNRDILPFIGKLPVTDLSVEQLERDVTNSLVERGALESARRVKSIMGMVLKLPFKRRLITYNPAYDITLPKPIKGNHNAVVSESELKTMLQKIWRYHAESPRARLRTELALKLSAYIYQRPNEIRELLWEHVDFENQRLCFRASKTYQEHIVPLSRQAFDILKQLEDMRTTSEKHRLRVEVTLDQAILKDTDCSIGNLKNIIKQGFKFLTFTKLDKKASEALKKSYDEVIKPYGKEQTAINVNRNKRTLRDGVKTYAELNSIVSKAIFNFYRKF